MEEQRAQRPSECIPATSGLRVLIVSDVHLDVSAAGEERMRTFVAFLRRLDAKMVSHLILLGDLFDFWFEYRHVVFSGYFDVLRALADLGDQGVQFHFVCGNHDFWGGRFLREALGFEVHDGPFMLRLGDQRVLFAHGDGINTDDRGYRLYKWIARARPVVALFRLLHPDWAMAIAQKVSHGSRRLRGVDDASKGPEAAALERFARETLGRGEADVVVCGHSHAPVMLKLPPGEGSGIYINAGGWGNPRTFVEWENGVFRQMSAGEDGDRIPRGKEEATEKQSQ